MDHLRAGDKFCPPHLPLPACRAIARSYAITAGMMEKRVHFCCCFMTERARGVSPCCTNGACSSITAQALLANSRQNKNHTAMTQSHAVMLSRSLTPNMPPRARIFGFLCVRHRFPKKVILEDKKTKKKVSEEPRLQPCTKRRRGRWRC